jgi:hypothetical protein
VRANDVILEVNGKSMVGLSHPEVSQHTSIIFLRVANVQ